MIQRRPFNKTMYFGFVFLAVANVVRTLLERYSVLAEDPRDGLVGVFYGLAIGCLILGMWRKTRPSSPSGESHCA
jgi:hypothetical protein